MNDPFGDIDRSMEILHLRTKRDAFLQLLDKTPKTEEDLAAIREAKKDPFLMAIFLFRDLYDLKKRGEGSLTNAQKAQIATMETQYANLVRILNEGQRKAMMLGKGRSRRRRLTRKRTRKTKRT